MTAVLTWDHGVTADTVAAWAISHDEGDFATLEITVANPRVGLLSGELWATFSYNGTTLFYGRLVGVPDDMQANAVKLVFIAEPDTFDADKEALAATLRTGPEWDPVWIAPDQRANPEAVLEARPYRWHIDRVTHALTISHIINGEAGNVAIDPDVVAYDSLVITPGETPVDTITCKADVNWQQKANSEFSLRGRLRKAFKDAHSFDSATSYITTYTGPGLISNWPKMGQSFGGGWKVTRSILLQSEDDTRVLSVRMRTGGFKSDSQPPAFDAYSFPINRGSPVDVEFGGDHTKSGDATYNDDGDE